MEKDGNSTTLASGTDQLAAPQLPDRVGTQSMVATAIRRARLETDFGSRLSRGTQCKWLSDAYSTFDLLLHPKGSPSITSAQVPKDTGQ